MEITLKLSFEEVNAIVQVMGELPTKTGIFPLVMKIKEQAESQVQDQKVDDGLPSSL